MQQCKDVHRILITAFSVFCVFFTKCKRNALCGQHVTLYQRVNHLSNFSLNFQETIFAKSSSGRNFHTQKSDPCDSHYLLKGVDKFTSTRFMSAGGCTGRLARNRVGIFEFRQKSVPRKGEFSIRTVHSYCPNRMQVGAGAHNTVHNLYL